MENLQPDEKPVFRASNKPFTCSKCVCVEYMDCINLAFITFLLNIQKADIDEDFPFDIDKIRCFTDVPMMFEWYVNRKHQNPLLDLLKDDYEIEDSVADDIINEELRKYEDFISIEIDTVVLQMLHILINNELAERYVIFHTHYNEHIAEYINDEFGSAVEYLYGDFEEDIIDQLPDDNVTYFFSDIEKVSILANNDKLEFCSVVVPQEYGYNKDEDGELLLDFEELSKYYIFKYATMAYFEY